MRTGLAVTEFTFRSDRGFNGFQTLPSVFKLEQPALTVRITQRQEIIEKIFMSGLADK